MSILAEYLPDGCGNIDTYSFPYISQLAVSYLKAGHDVDVFTSSTAVTTPQVIDAGRLRVYIGRRRKSARHRGIDFFRVERRDLRDAMQLAEPDVIHAHWTYEFAAAALSAQKDSLVTAHDSPQALIRHYHHVYWWLRAALGVVTVRRAKNLTLVSPSLSKQIKRIAYKKTSIKVIPNGVKPQEVNLKTSRPPRDVFRYACVANGFDSRKNTKVAIEAFALVRRVYPDSVLALFGSGHGVAEEAYTWSRELGIAAGIEFRGQTSHDEILRSFSQEIDVLVHPSVWEACSVAILESASYGVPVIGGSNSGGVPFTLGYGRIGVLTDIKNKDSLAHEMILMQDNRTVLDEKRVSARDYVTENFSYEDVVTEYLAQLKAIVANRTANA
ncbi:glycosyltransferase family 4 protein [Rhodococcus cercidiphylli]|uniref:Glycosyltransferase family 4 protein n=1 Tax=Rhodococcus cercidiphylli TaxID=489916 RepID=A0ABU4B3U7_9NOCA|nr:glycosyltransferase family 4 protein [Rhodococcus cercidiphylli]MDV6233174.1 glycosyltransferase family 4 protein [Rhodococcus cercidiphylli]